MFTDNKDGNESNRASILLTSWSIMFVNTNNRYKIKGKRIFKSNNKKILAK